MADKRSRPEKIVTKLRQFEVLTEQGKPRPDAILQIGVTEQTYYCWSAGGQEKTPVRRFPAKQVNRNWR
ncbi:hypothetical protein GFB49_03415 [Epibacterium sp. SM1979]|uniref:Transposase n=1 Tax=Tritonibacter litoralis TaxID=2662264 RepID=A0A843YDV7_9RHOB|nr:hypothetical protein [Tritonibacter litoralis]